MEIDQIEAQIEELRNVMGGMNPHAADRMRALAHADDLKLFWIVNTAGRKAYFLARSARLARHSAVAANHIQQVDNGTCYQAGESFFTSNGPFGSSVKRAIKDRVPGPIVQKGNHAMMGDRIYSPLTSVPK